MAAACGIKLRTFQNWINRDLYPTVLDGFKLAHTLGVTVEYLIMGTDDFTSKFNRNRVKECKSASTKIKKLALKICNETEQLR